MEAKGKAIELVNKYKWLKLTDLGVYLDLEEAKHCALIAVDELVACSISYDNYNATWASQVKYWEEVKQEIEKL